MPGAVASGFRFKEKAGVEVEVVVVVVEVVALVDPGSFNPNPSTPRPGAPTEVDGVPTERLGAEDSGREEFPIEANNVGPEVVVGAEVAGVKPDSLEPKANADP